MSSEERKKFASMGGKAKKASMTPEQRIENARLAGSMKGKKGVPKASHCGELKIGEISIPCAVVNGKRLISQSALYRAFGGKYKGRKSNNVSTRIQDTPHFLPFLASENFMSLVTEDLEKKMTPLKFVWTKTNSIAVGYDATLLPDICKLFLEGRRLGILNDKQLEFSKVSEILLGGLATVGILALIDENTGFQEERERDELTKILQKYVAIELQPWTKRFHPEFFKQVYRIHGWKWGQFNNNHPSCVGNFINKFVYEKLPPGVLEELRSKNPVNDSGKRSHCHHQFLTPGIGHTQLDGHLRITQTLMRMATDKDDFKRLFERAFPDDQLLLDIQMSS